MVVESGYSMKVLEKMQKNDPKLNRVKLPRDWGSVL